MEKKNVILYITLGVLCLFLACLSTNYDYDLFARLIVGERFVDNGILPFQDFLSYTPTHPWYDHEWGSGVVFYFVLKHFGPFGLLALQALLMFLTSIFIVKVQKLQKHFYPPSIIFLSIFLVLYMKLNSSIIRCQMFSFFFFSVFLYLLEKVRQKNIKWQIWLIPVLVIVWNNLHGGVVSGLGLVFLYFIGALLERKPWKNYFGVMVLSCPLLTINPYGVKYLNFLFSATTMHRKYVVEWWPFYNKKHVMFYMPAVIYTLLGFILNFVKKNKIDITKTIVLFVTLCEGLAHVKLLSLSLITVAAFCYSDFVRFFRKLPAMLGRSVYITIWLMAMLIPLFSPTVPRADLSKFPLYEVEFLKINELKGNIVVPFGLGSYISYKLYPDNLIYMDGRYEEVYNNEEFYTLRDFELAENNWKDIITKYPTDILVPSKFIEVYDVLKSDPDWTLVFEGMQCGVFVKKGSEKKSYIEPEYKIDYYRKTIFNHGDFKND